MDKWVRSFFICQYPKVEARITEELRGLGLLATPEQPQPRALEHADLGKLTHLTCAIKVCASDSACALHVERNQQHGLLLRRLQVQLQ